MDEISAQTVTDADLLGRIRAGEGDAYATLWSRRSQAACGHARRVARERLRQASLTRAVATSPDCSSPSAA